MWIYKNNIIDKLNIPFGAIGFVYIIKDLQTNRRYIGKKNLYSTTKRHFGKKQLSKVCDNRLKKYEYITKDSNWAAYKSSNDTVKKWGNTYREILEFAFSSKELTYLEVKHQFDNNVLEDDLFVNDNILGKFFKHEFNSNNYDNKF